MLQGLGYRLKLHLLLLHSMLVLLQTVCVSCGLHGCRLLLYSLYWLAIGTLQFSNNVFMDSVNPKSRCSLCSTIRGCCCSSCSWSSTRNGAKYCNTLQFQTEEFHTVACLSLLVRSRIDCSQFLHP